MSDERDGYEFDFSSGGAPAPASPSVGARSGGSGESARTFLPPGVSWGVGHDMLGVPYVLEIVEGQKAKRIVGEPYGWRVDLERCERTARLWASSPALLALCSEAANVLEGTELGERLRAASKVEG